MFLKPVIIPFSHEHDHLDHIPKGYVNKGANSIPRISCYILGCEGKETGQWDNGDSIAGEDNGGVDVGHVRRNAYWHEDEQSVRVRMAYDRSHCVKH
jgi:hypothetical protein